MPIDRSTKMWTGPSRSEQFMQNRSTVPQISPSVANNVSQYRKEMLAKEVQAGLFKDGSGSVSKENVSTDNSAVLVGGGINKMAQSIMGGGSGNFRGGSGDVVKQTPEVYSPLWLTSNLNLPRDRATINAWCRSFFALNPFVSNAIHLHSTYPISKLNIKCKNKKAETFFNNMIEEIDLMNVLVAIAQEYFLLGETFVYAELDESKGKWSRLMIQNPDYMLVKRTVVANEPIIMLRPDENLKKIVTSNRKADIEQRKQLNQHIIESVRRGENIPLDNFHVSHLARRISPYEIRGTGLPVSIFRQLMLYDQLRESKFAQAASMINPLTLVKVGTDGPDGLKPTFADLEAYRSVFEQLQYDKDAKIFTHPGVTVERIGYGQGIYDISGDITQLIKEIYVGLEVPSVVIEGGDSTTYANGGVALDVMRQRYMTFRNMLSNWLKRKIFAPISKIQGFYDYVEGEKQLIVPEIDWNHMSLFDTADYVSQLVSLTAGEPSQRRISLHSLYRSMGLEQAEEERKIRKEAIQASILKKEQESLDKMTLNELRILNEDSEIKDKEDEEGESAAPSKEAPLPGESLPGLEAEPPMPPGSPGPPGSPPPPV